MRKLRTALLAVALVVSCTGVASAQNRGSALQDAIYKQIAQFTRQQFERRGYVCAPAPSWMPRLTQYLWYLATCARSAR
ncbi:MAG: hypothetical protein M3416_00040 [Acidobacteriota bacterium]|nr:hypothetical protein [Acidobacteriota bacterium]